MCLPAFWCYSNSNYSGMYEVPLDKHLAIQKCYTYDMLKGV